MKNIVLTFALAVCLSGIAGQMAAQTAAPTPLQPDSRKLDEARKRADSASSVIIQIMSNGDKSIPRELLEKASAVVVFPGVLKGAFVVGGQGGHGLVVRRTRDGWSAPAFLKMAGGSFGPQIGGSK